MAQDQIHAPTAKRLPEAMEMLEFCKSLDIDPVKESEMLWIAEDAINAPLPLGWSEHTDGHGHTFFHNLATGKSAWMHPMDDLYRKVVEYFRTVQHVGGFWTVEDDIAAQEEQIRNDLNEWMELFDAQGDKYYYNRRTEDSRFDDPRNEMYHNLYERIKMVAKMKERLPLLARAPRPDEATPYEIRLKNLRDQEEQAYMKSVVLLQCFSRMMAAKRTMRKARAKRELGRGHQPLRGRLRLRLEAIGPTGHKELVLGETTPHRRHRMAARIQARVRGVQCRERMKPLRAHEEFRSKLAVRMQKQIRIMLGIKRAAKEAIARIYRAAAKIQARRRGIVARAYVKRVRFQRRGFEEIKRSVTKVQCLFRLVAAKEEFKRRKALRYQASTLTIQTAVKIRKARQHLVSLLQMEEPVQARFMCTTDEKANGVMPFTFQIWLAPVNEDTGYMLKPPRRQHNLFYKYAPDNIDQVAIETIQKIARGMIARFRFRRTLKMARDAAEAAIAAAANELARRTKAVTYMQKCARGFNNRKVNKVLGQKRLAWIQRRMPQIVRLQASWKKFVFQDEMKKDTQNYMRDQACLTIQKYWRGYVARRLHDKLAMECLWPLKGFFDFTATGPKSVHIGIKFYKNPRYDAEKYFMWQGGEVALLASLQDMRQEVTSCVDNYLSALPWDDPANPLYKEPSEEEKELQILETQLDNPDLPEEERSLLQDRAAEIRRKLAEASRSGSKSRTGSKAGSRPSSKQGSKEGSKRPSVSGAEGAGEASQPAPLKPGSAASKGPSVAASAAPEGSAAAAPAEPQNGETAAAVETPPSAGEAAPAVAELPVEAEQTAAEPAPAEQTAAEAASATEPEPAPVPQPAVTMESTGVQAAPELATVSAQVSRAPSGIGSERGIAPAAATQPAPETAAHTDPGAFGNEEPREQSSIDPTLTGSPSPDQSVNPSDATMRPEMNSTNGKFQQAGRQVQSMQSTAAKFGQSGALAALADAKNEREGEREAIVGPEQPPGAPRKHYAGKIGPDGKFERTKAHNLKDLTEDEQREILADLDMKRQQKVEDLMRRQKKKEQKIKKEKMKALHGSTGPKELKALLREDSKPQGQTQRERQHEKMALQTMQAEMAEKYAANQEDKISKRLNVAGARKAKQEEVLQHGRMGRTVGAAYPAQHQAQQQAMAAQMMMAQQQQQRMLHRHVHHHMHYHSGEMADGHASADTQLPYLPQAGGSAGWTQGATAGPLGGMRRSASDVGSASSGLSGGPRQKMSLTQAASVGNLLQQ